MELLLEELYKQDITANSYVDRKIYIDHQNKLNIYGVTLSGKTYLLKHTLLGLKKSQYLYINLNDERVHIDEYFTFTLSTFIKNKKITHLVLDNYSNNFILPNVEYIYVSSNIKLELDGFEYIKLFPLDYEEFLAYEIRYDSNAINSYLLLGGFPINQTLANDLIITNIQKSLKYALNSIEYDILKYIATSTTNTISAFTLYERLKQNRKISKDYLYKNFKSIKEKGYIHEVAKFESKKTIKKLYLCDISIKHAFTSAKHFSKTFENLVFLEMLKNGFEIFYLDEIDFYIPKLGRMILSMPFTSQEALFKKVEKIEAFVITNNIKTIEVVTLSSNSTIKHPFVQINLVPFYEWAIFEAE